MLMLENFWGRFINSFVFCSVLSETQKYYSNMDFSPILFFFFLVGWIIQSKLSCNKWTIF